MRALRRKALVGDAVKGIALFAAALVVAPVVEHSAFGRQMELAGYNLIQSAFRPASVPIAIVDISGIEPTTLRLGYHATPRAPLRELIEAIATQAHPPIAIGVDVDFSPDSSGFVFPDDPQFFDACLQIEARTGVPIYLGVARSIARPRGDRLGSGRFASLAAGILIPRDSRRMIDVIRILDSESDNRSSPVSRSMSTLLAQAYIDSHNPGSPAGVPHSILAGMLRELGMVEQVRETRLGSGVTVDDYLIDYSALDSLRPIPATDRARLRNLSESGRLEDRIVLIGDADIDRSGDAFSVPGRQTPLPGVFLHAAATYTIIHGPLLEVTQLGRICLDGVFSLVVFLLAFSVRLLATRQARFEHSTFANEAVSIIVVSVAIVAGGLFVWQTRIIWEDFILVLGMLLFHPSIERVFHGTISGITHRVRGGRAAAHAEA